MLLETLSVPLQKAFPVNSVQSAPVQPLQQMTVVEPGQFRPDDPSVFASASEYANGIFPERYQPGAVQANRIYILPYCDGGAGMQFSLRLFGWRLIGGARAFWVRTPICQLFCTSGDIPGIGQDFQMTASENLCDSIQLSAGSVGYGGEIVNFAGGYPAYALIDLKGCQKWQFEFEQYDMVGMNAFHARC